MPTNINDQSPITLKRDGVSLAEKGNYTPEQLAQINAIRKFRDAKKARKKFLNRISEMSKRRNRE